MKDRISIETFHSIDMRVGTVLRCEPFPKARNPSYKLWIDFGELGILKSSAQITVHYTVEDLVGKQVIAVVNFEPRQIADFMSECLVLGCVNTKTDVILLSPDKQVDNGMAIA